MACPIVVVLRSQRLRKSRTIDHHVRVRVMHPPSAPICPPLKALERHPATCLIVHGIAELLPQTVYSVLQMSGTGGVGIQRGSFLRSKCLLSGYVGR